MLARCGAHRNWNINKLLQGKAEDSPFTRVLKAGCDNFVLVANEQVETYSRIWCVCELHTVRMINESANKHSSRKTTVIQQRGAPTDWAEQAKTLKAWRRCTKIALDVGGITVRLDVGDITRPVGPKPLDPMQASS